MLASITALELEELSQLASLHLNELLNDLGVIQKHSVLAVFAPIEQEPLWFLSLDEVYKDFTAFPAITNEGMVFRKARLEDLESKLDFGVSILGPPSSGLIVTPGIVLVPGLGFNEEGARLGRGKGYYDRALEESALS